MRRALQDAREEDQQNLAERRKVTDVFVYHYAFHPFFAVVETLLKEAMEKDFPSFILLQYALRRRA